MDDYKQFIEKIHHKIGIDLSLYKEGQMKRRILSLRNKLGFTNFDSYYKALMEDDQLLEQFIDRITINVTEFYRNPKRWTVLREKVFPEIIKNKKKIKIWSAACSTGEEPYSIAIMLAEHFSHVEAEILATDIDERVIEQAKLGIYQGPQLKDLPSHKKTKYFTFKNRQYYLHDDIKRKITFRQHDLLKDSYPSNLDLIVCRNVLIYFTDEAKEQIYHRFSRSLNDGGMLFVGSTEQIFNPAKYGFKLYETFFYQKI